MSESNKPMKTSRKSVKKAVRQSLAAGGKKAGNTVAEIKGNILRHLHCTQAHDISTATKRDWWVATSLAVRDCLLEDMIATMQTHNDQDTRRVYYLSLEYLMGRLLQNNIANADLTEQVHEALGELGIDPVEVFEQELDTGLGNGGLGRLAACFLDSLATLDLPAVGYGIYYEFGLFKQEFLNGRQIEKPDDWLRFGDPWDVMRPEHAQEVRLYGRVEHRYDECGDMRPCWVDTSTILGVPHDIPIAGYGTKTVNFLRLWDSKASEEFDFDTFNEGGYVEAMREKAMGESISKVLYPNDKTENGKELRLVQQYFFVSCSLHDIIRRYHKKHDNWDAFAEKVFIQLNDTHPAVAVPELMRIFLDEEKMGWEEAWKLVNSVFGYTNHTLLPEALEKWSVPLFEKVLPRHMEIIFEINRRHMEEVEARWPGDDQKKASLSLIEEGSPKMVRMAYMAVIASSAVNGVAALHTQLLKQDLFREFDEMFPGRLQNKTNGITPRRWLKVCNPRLSDLISEKIGDSWPKNLNELRGLEEFAGDRDFQKAFMDIKRQNKVDLAEVIKDKCGVEVSPDAMFDVQIKRLHEYKRQHLNLLHILTWYRRILHHQEEEMSPRVFLFAAKAAPGYDLAKSIIHAINAVGHTINNDPRVKGRIKVVFLPNYSVSMAEKIVPAADLSEQISTAGKEASGTGNMKLALNGALTVGTLDGANVEIREEVGEENIFIFGKEVEEVEAIRKQGYNPWDIYHQDGELKAVLDWLASGHFTQDEPDALKPVVHSLLDGGDPFLVLADYRAYLDIQKDIDATWKDPAQWAEKAILNTARVGKFSSDRTISQYAEEIWNLKPVPVKG